ncbi:MAG: electron transfer flavoprotein subunit alpha/FixB family protein [Pseudomonadota bacterium]
MSTHEFGGDYVLAVAEHAGGRLAPISLELAAAAADLAGRLGLAARVAVLAAEPAPMAAQAAAQCGLPVWAVKVPGLEVFHGEAQGRALAALLARRPAAAVLAGHTTSGLDWAPWLAARLGGAIVSGVERLEGAGEGLRLGRTGHHGKVWEDLRPLAWPLVVTVQPGAFSAADPPAGRGAIEALALDAPTARGRVLALREAGGADAGLSQAQVVVAGGRGLGKPENLDLLRRLAGLFSHAALAGSRPICDLGWLGYASQVGQTGATVAPRLYIACGISGARQHTLGMQAAGFIVAINSDPQAAICNLADVCVIDDLTAFIPALLAAAGGE